jgi:predicted DCC family thiol-disulfide oxidoreductase YuxK
MPHGTDVILYDGVCALCNGFVRFVLARDSARRFRFASLQSGFAAAQLARRAREARDLDTLYVLADQGGAGERLLATSRGVLHVLGHVDGPGWRWLAAALGLLPTALLDAAYGVVVRNRYRTFGRYDTCPLPRPEDRDRFVDV